MYNAKCLKCGSPGYQGFVDFECSNSKCSFFKAVGADDSVDDVFVPVRGAEQSVPVPAPPPMPSGGNGFYKIAGPAQVTGNHTTTTPHLNTQHSFGTIEYQKDAAREVLRRFHSHNNNYIIGLAAEVAGGAPLDWIYGRPAKDIDVYVTAFDEGAFLKEFGICATPAKGSKTQNKYPDNFTVFNFGIWGLDFQVIDTHGKPVKDYVDGFDFGINMIRYDESGNFHYHPEHLQDRTNQTLTFYPSKIIKESVYNLYDRYQRMLKKFPGYKLEMGK